MTIRPPLGPSLPHPGWTQRVAKVLRRHDTESTGLRDHSLLAAALGGEAAGGAGGEAEHEFGGVQGHVTAAHKDVVQPNVPHILVQLLYLPLAGLPMNGTRTLSFS
jgi:hypothetical protein